MPKVSDIVQFLVDSDTSGRCGGAMSIGDVASAVITGVNGDGTVNVKIFIDGNYILETMSVSQGTTNGTWRVAV